LFYKTPTFKAAVLRRFWFSFLWRKKDTP